MSRLKHIKSFKDYINESRYGGRTGRTMGGPKAGGMQPMITTNSVFKVKIATVDDKLEEKPGSEPDVSTDDLKKGMIITGFALGDTKNSRTGKIEKVIKDSKGNIEYVEMTDEDGEYAKIDPTTVSKHDFHGTGKESNI